MTNLLVISVVPNWNLKGDLSECLDSLLSNSYSPHQIVVVDNGSTDGSVEYVRVKYPSIELISLPDNRGYAGAINVGLKYALSKNAGYIFILNNDTVVKPQTIQDLVDILANNISIGILTPKIVNYTHPEILNGLGDRRYRWSPIPLGFGYRKRDNPRYSGLMEFDYVTGCAMLISSEVVRKVGFWDCSFHMYYEDADYSHRVRDLGYRIVCAGSTTIYHKGASSSKNIRPAITRTRARNRVFFYRRYPHGPHPLFTYIVLILVGVWRSLSYLLSGRCYLIQPYLGGLWAGCREPLPKPRYD